MIPKRTIIIALVVLRVIWPPFLIAQEEFMYWEGNFAPISLADVTTRDTVSTGSSMVRLLMSGDVAISADNSAAARLSGPGGGHTALGLQGLL